MAAIILIFIFNYLSLMYIPGTEDKRTHLDPLCKVQAHKGGGYSQWFTLGHHKAEEH